MRRKPASLVGILAVAMALGAGSVAQGDSGQGQYGAQRILADNNGPKPVS
jgi:hypothetical protein